MRRDDDERSTMPRGTDCCSSADPRIAAHFDGALQARLSSGGLPPLHPTSRHLLAALSDVPAAGLTVLEIGCGSGALLAELLARGAVRATGVDLSAVSVDTARVRLAEAGLDDRASIEVGDGATVSLMTHDWVVLDRVLCCYRDVDRLLANAISAAGSRLAFTVPESLGVRGLVNRLLMRVELIVTRLQGRPCPGYVHDLRRIETALGAAGFRPGPTRTDGLWRIAVFARWSAPPLPAPLPPSAHS